MPRLRSALSWSLRTATRLAWFILTPALLAGLTLRYLVPPPRAEGTGLLHRFSELAAQLPAPVAGVLFVYFALIVRYWARWLPGAASWLPPVATRATAAQRTLRVALPLGVAIAAAFLARSFYAPYRVQSASMLPTLEPGAVLVAEQSAYGVRALGSTAKQPRRGDVIVLRGPDADAPPLVKRVIGLPGDVVRVNFGHPLINEWIVPGCNAGRYTYLSEQGLTTGNLVVEFLDDAAYVTLHSVPLSASMASYVVPPGEVFVLGDNRNNSSDSRAWNDGNGGSVSLANVVGRVRRLLFAAQRDGQLDASSLLRPLSAPLRAEGIDTTAMRASIDECLAKRPKQTHPPASSSTSVSSVSAASMPHGERARP